MAQRPIVIVSNRGPLSFPSDDDGDLVAGAARAASCPAWPRWSPAPTPSGSPPPCPTATARPPPAGWSRPRASGSGCSSIDPDVYRARLRRGLQRHALVRPPRPLRAGPPPPLRPPLPRGLGGLPRGQPGLRRRGRRDGAPRARPCSCRTTTCPCWRPLRGRAPARPAPRALQPHAVRRPRQLAGAARRPRPRAARRHGRPPRLRLPLPPVGRRLRRLLRRAARAGRRPPSWPRSPPTPTTSAGSPRASACAAALAELDAEVGDRALLVRVDRIELSKNILRGFHAFDDLLERYPEWREQVVFGAFVYPSREGLPEYLAYRQEVEADRAAHQRAVGHRRTGRRSSSTRPTTSPARSPRCAAPTCCW